LHIYGVADVELKVWVQSVSYLWNKERSNSVDLEVFHHVLLGHFKESENVGNGSIVDEQIETLSLHNRLNHRFCRGNGRLITNIYKCREIGLGDFVYITIISINSNSTMQTVVEPNIIRNFNINQSINLNVSRPVSQSVNQNIHLIYQALLIIYTFSKVNMFNKLLNKLLPTKLYNMNWWMTGGHLLQVLQIKHKNNLFFITFHVATFSFCFDKTGLEKTWLIFCEQFLRLWICESCFKSLCNSWLVTLASRTSSLPQLTIML